MSDLDDDNPTSFSLSKSRKRDGSVSSQAADGNGEVGAEVTAVKTMAVDEDCEIVPIISPEEKDAKAVADAAREIGFEDSGEEDDNGDDSDYDDGTGNLKKGAYTTRSGRTTKKKAPRTVAVGSGFDQSDYEEPESEGEDEVKFDANEAAEGADDEEEDDDEAWDNDSDFGLEEELKKPKKKAKPAEEKKKAKTSKTPTKAAPAKRAKKEAAKPARGGVKARSTSSSAAKEAPAKLPTARARKPAVPREMPSASALPGSPGKVRVGLSSKGGLENLQPLQIGGQPRIRAGLSKRARLQPLHRI